MSKLKDIRKLIPKFVSNNKINYNLAKIVLEKEIKDIKNEKLQPENPIKLKLNSEKSEKDNEKNVKLIEPPNRNIDKFCTPKKNENEDFKENGEENKLISKIDQRHVCKTPLLSLGEGLSAKLQEMKNKFNENTKKIQEIKQKYINIKESKKIDINISSSISSKNIISTSLSIHNKQNESISNYNIQTNEKNIALEKIIPKLIASSSYDINSSIQSLSANIGNKNKNIVNEEIKNQEPIAKRPESSNILSVNESTAIIKKAFTKNLNINKNTSNPYIFLPTKIENLNKTSTQNIDVKKESREGSNCSFIRVAHPIQRQNSCYENKEFSETNKIDVNHRDSRLMTSFKNASSQYLELMKEHERLQTYLKGILNKT